MQYEKAYTLCYLSLKVWTLFHTQVDVIFDDDTGLLAAIKTFMTTTKRPVVLTTNGKHKQKNCDFD